MNAATVVERLEARISREFPGDVAQHEMRVHLDEGIYRHLECRQPGTRTRLFTITTWPGELCISGDMGTFVFSRLTDMFEFFRNPRCEINSGYWSEKLVASRGSRGAMEFDGDIFRREITRWLDEHIEGAHYLPEDEDALRDDVAAEVLSCADDGEIRAYDAARRFEYDGESIFQDFWEVNCREYTYHFLWCCHAIVWAIAQYDARATADGAA